MSTRRSFIKKLSVAGIGLAISGIANESLIASDKTKEVRAIKPRKLSKGDKVGLVAPASYISEKEIVEIKENLNKLGLIGEFSKNFSKRSGYLSGSDNERLNDLHTMFSRKDIKAIICARGGYGTPRILSKIDYNLIKKNPKIIIGYSDITALLQAIYIKTGLITFHGPVGISTFNDFSLNYFNQVLFEGKKRTELISEKSDQSEKPNNSIEDILIIKDGIAEGTLIGGNLSLVVSLLGSEFDFNPKNKILFLEEIGEEPYRIDRMLTQLLLTDKLQGCKAIVLGQFVNCENKKTDPAFEVSFTLKEILLDRFSGLKIPIIYGLSFGHIKNKFTLPLGIKARLDTQNKKLILLENAVA